MFGQISKFIIGFSRDAIDETRGYVSKLISSLLFGRENTIMIFVSVLYGWRRTLEGIPIVLVDCGWT